MLLAHLIFVASLLIVAFHAITAMPHIRERHVIRVPIKFKVIHHHQIKRIPIYIRKHVHYYKDKAPVIEDTHTNHIFHDDGDDHLQAHFEFHQEKDHPELLHPTIATHEDDYDEEEQSQEEEYEDDEYE